MEILRNYRKYLLDIFLIAILLITLLVIRGNISNIISPFIYALVLAYILNPLVNYLEKKNIKRVYASLLLLAGILVFISLIFVNIIPRIGNDLSVFVLEIPNIFNFIENFVHEIRAGESNILPSYFSNLIDIDQEIQRLSTILRNSFSNLSTALIQTTGKLLDIILTPIITFYYLKDKEKLLASSSKLLQRDGFKILSDILKDIDRVLGGFIKGQLIVATFIGILTGVGAAVLGVPYSVTIGLVAGVTNIIPYFGPCIGGILPVILALMKSPITALWVVIWIIVVQQIESVLISPQIMSHSVGLHPLTVVFSVMLFGNIFGIWGMIIGVPLAGAIKVVVPYILDLRKQFKTNYKEI